MKSERSAGPPLRQSLLVSLIDEDPTAASDRVDTRGQQLKRLQDSVRHDLERLLNTREPCEAWPKGCENLEKTAIAFGIPDISGADLASSQLRLSFLEKVKLAIRSHDRRLQEVRVEAIEGDDAAERRLRFRIHAILRAEDGPHSEQFEFQLEPVSRKFE